MRNRVARLASTLTALAFAWGVARAPGHVSMFTAAYAEDAHTPAEIVSARKLFAEALADQGAQRYAAALEKFQRVQAFRDTQAVRYRVAMCLEALGKLRAALEAYTAASVAGAANDAESANVARASRDKMEALGKRVARVVVKLSPRAPDDTSVKIDGEPVQANAIDTPVVVDPGAHEITASGSGAPPFRAGVTLAEGGTTTIDVTLEAPRHAPPLPPMETIPAASRAATAPLEATPLEPAPSSHAGRTTAGVLAVTAGGVLVAGSVVLVLVRHAEIASLDAACPGGVCPAARESELEATRSRALLEGPAAIGVGAAGIIAAAVGVVLLATSGGSRSAALVPWLDKSARGVAWSARF